MIKLITPNSIKFVLGGIALLFVSYILEVNMIVAVFLLAMLVYLLRGKPARKTYKLLDLVFLYVLIFVSAYLLVDEGLSILYLPFPVIPMLATLIFADLEVSFILSLACGLSIAAISGNNLYLGLLFISSAILSSLLVVNARRRAVIIRAGVLVGLLQALSLFLMRRILLFPLPDQYLIVFLNGALSGIIVVGILPLFEYLFRRLTNISLLELADFNHPLLHRMITEAPGTYHHSLIVGNLSEAACREIGANALFARIGAYYHDIGKLEKPDYFSENQRIPSSRHDSLSPTMSKLVIMNHVKEGVELAKKYKLNPGLIDFIQQHHGNSLVYYFYRRALENNEEYKEIKEEGFRYPGPKPNSKETAIVLLADSVEAATRSLKEPTAANIEELVHKVINNKFIDTQLDECELTLKDLEKISAVFIKILAAMYHSRVNYPESTESENNNKKPAKELSRQPQKDKGADS